MRRLITESIPYRFSQHLSLAQQVPPVQICRSNGLGDSKQGQACRDGNSFYLGQLVPYADNDWLLASFPAVADEGGSQNPKSLVDLDARCLEGNSDSVTKGVQ